MAGKVGRSGRKTKAEELGLPLLLAEWVPETRRKKMWLKLASLAEEGDLKALELFFAYAYGKPKQTLEHSAPGGGPVAVTIIEVVKDYGDTDGGG